MQVSMYFFTLVQIPIPSISFSWLCLWICAFSFNLHPKLCFQYWLLLPVPTMPCSHPWDLIGSSYSTQPGLSQHSSSGLWVGVVANFLWLQWLYVKRCFGKGRKMSTEAEVAYRWNWSWKNMLRAITPRYSVPLVGFFYFQPEAITYISLCVSQ